MGPSESDAGAAEGATPDFGPGRVVEPLAQRRVPEDRVGAVVLAAGQEPGVLDDQPRRQERTAGRAGPRRQRRSSRSGCRARTCSSPSSCRSPASSHQWSMPLCLTLPLLGEAHVVLGRVVVVRGVEELLRVELVTERRRHPELHGAVAPVVVDPVVVRAVVVAAGDQHAGADRGRDHRAHGAVDVAALRHRLVADALVDVLRVVVLVVAVDLVVAPPGVVLREPGVAGEQRVRRDAGGVVVELVVVRPDRVAGGAGVAQRVVVAAVVADLDGVALDLEGLVVGVEVGARAGVDARVAVVVVVRALDQAVVAGEREDAVLVVAAGGQPVEHEPVGLEHVDRVELGLLERHVRQVGAAGAVQPDRVELLEPVVDQHVGHLRARCRRSGCRRTCCRSGSTCCAATGRRTGRSG